MKINEIIKEDASGFTDPSARQRSQGVQSYQDVATASAEPAPAATAPAAPSKLNKLKQLGTGVASGISNATAGVSSFISGVQGKAQARETAKVFIDRWNKAVAQNPDLKTDTQALMNFMSKSTEKSGIEVPPPAGDISKSAVVAQYITDVISKSMAANTINAPSARSNTKGIEIVSGIDNPNDPPEVLFQGQNFYIDPVKGKWVDSRGVEPIPPLQDKFFQAFGQAAPNNLSAQNALLRASQNPPADQTAPQAQTAQLKLKRVNVAGGEYAEKHPDGKWYDGQGDMIVRPDEIAELERRASQPPASAGAYVR
jgi:uncharacterized phage infection (PIP) family protein YhgE